MAGGFCGQWHGHGAGTALGESAQKFYSHLEFQYLFFNKHRFVMICDQMSEARGVADSGHVFGCPITCTTGRRFTAPKAGEWPT